MQVEARSDNGLTTGAFSGPVFTMDSQGPSVVTVQLGGASSTFVAGAQITVAISGGTDSYSPAIWTWTAQRTDAAAPSITSTYKPGAPVALTVPGQYDITFTAQSGSGISASSAPVAVTITSTGLAVGVMEQYTDGQGTVGGYWNDVGGGASSYQYQWLDSQGTILQRWTAGDISQSSTISLTTAGLVPAAGDQIILEVQALNAQGTPLGNSVQSPGIVVETTPPEFDSFTAPSFVRPSDVWVSFQGDDKVSGIAQGSVVVKQYQASSSSWVVISTDLVNLSGGVTRVDQDLSALLSTGSQIVVQATLTNGAGIRATQASGIIGVDGAPPPVPVVMTMAEAVN